MGRATKSANNSSSNEFTTEFDSGNSEDTTAEYSGTDHNSINPAADQTGSEGNPAPEPTPEPEPKRGRGRPRKDTTEKGEVFSVQEKKRVVKNRSVKPDERKLYTVDESKAATAIILGIVESLAVSVLGNEAGFNPIEKTLLEESIPNFLQRMSVSTAEKTANFMYPAMIGFATVSYGARMIKLAKEKQPKSHPIPNSHEYYEDLNQQNNNDNNNDNPTSFNPGWNGGRGF